MKLTPQQEVDFLVQLQRLLTEGQFVATYKFALLMALADLSVEKGRDDASELILSTRELAEKMTRYYWRQCAPYPGEKVEVFRQNTGREAGIIRMVKEAQQKTRGSLPRFIRQSGEWKKLIGEVDAVVRSMPLWKLQTVGNERLNFLYENLDRGTSITLNPGVAACFRKFYGLVSELVRGSWLRYIRQFNQDVLGNAADLQEFLFGSERADLGVVAPILNEFQSGRCFYCNAPLKRDIAHVDHFIPWSRYPVDLGHNFVLAHEGCNSSKSDRLAAREHLAKWSESVKRAELQAELDRCEIINDVAVSVRVTQWAYRQSASAGGLTWLKGNVLVGLPEGWEQLLEN
jgi:hypothetical protein